VVGSAAGHVDRAERLLPTRRRRAAHTIEAPVRRLGGEVGARAGKIDGGNAAADHDWCSACIVEVQDRFQPLAFDRMRASRLLRLAVDWEANPGSPLLKSLDLKQSEAKLTENEQVGVVSEFLNHAASSTGPADTTSAPPGPATSYPAADTHPAVKPGPPLATQ